MRPVARVAAVVTLVALAVSLAGAAASLPRLVITGGTLIDGTGRGPSSDSLITLEGPTIAGVTTTGPGPTPADAEHIDARGKWIIPGLIDMHVHYYEWMAPQFLRHGVTTVRDVGNDLDRILELRRQSRTDESTQPRLFACGPLIDGPSPRHGAAISLSVRTEGEAREAARRLIARGVDCLKVYEQLTLPLVGAIVQEARSAGVPVIAHLRDTTAAAALTAGVSGLEHALGFEACDEREGAEVSRLLLERNAYVVPTLVVMHHESRRLPCLQRFVGRLRKLGGRVLAGSDTANLRPLAGLLLLRELELLVDAGLSPEHALMAATSGAAEALGQRGRLGTIEPGAMADIVVLAGDPLSAIGEIRRVELVIRAGRVVWRR